MGGKMVLSWGGGVKWPNLWGAQGSAVCTCSAYPYERRLTEATAMPRVRAVIMFTLGFHTVYTHQFSCDRCFQRVPALGDTRVFVSVSFSRFFIQ